MLSFERLKELKSWVSDLRKFGVSEGNEIIVLIDAEIARQSVKSEDAAEAIQAWVSVSERLPESGKHVLLCCEIKPLGKRYVCDGYYAQSKTITAICDDDNNCEYDEETDEYYLIEGYYEIINNCEYDEETDEYYLIEGYYEVVKNWDYYSSIVIDDFVTHWKPLPEPPKGE